MKLRTAAAAVAIASAAAGLYLWYGELSPDERWRRSPKLALAVTIVDYTVPFENYREHAGVMWVLNHLRVIAPEDLPLWLPSRHYIGYSPLDRDAPVRLEAADIGDTDLIYVADTYGVYRDDLKHIDERRAHMDYSPLVFGGLSEGDAEALVAHANRGGAVIGEFNTLCEPTSPAVRARAERLFGVTWTEWVGRVFQNPRDTDDVPHWFPREFERQFPGRPFPTDPMLVLIGRGGVMHVFEGDSLRDVAPRVMLTADGETAFPDALSGAPYYYWFAVVEADPDARVYATLTLPDRPDVASALADIGAPAAPPAMVEPPRRPGRVVYFAGDFGEPDFQLGPYGSANIIQSRRSRIRYVAGVTQAQVFWYFYAPVARDLIAAIAAEAATQRDKKIGLVTPNGRRPGNTGSSDALP